MSADIVGGIASNTGTSKQAVVVDTNHLKSILTHKTKAYVGAPT